MDGNCTIITVCFRHCVFYAPWGVSVRERYLFVSSLFMHPWKSHTPHSFRNLPPLLFRPSLGCLVLILSQGLVSSGSNSLPCFVLSVKLVKLFLAFHLFWCTFLPGQTMFSIPLPRYTRYPSGASQDPFYPHMCILHIVMYHDPLDSFPLDWLGYPLDQHSLIYLSPSSLSLYHIGVHPA